MTVVTRTPAPGPGAARCRSPAHNGRQPHRESRRPALALVGAAIDGRPACADELELRDVGHFSLPIDSRSLHRVATALARSDRPAPRSGTVDRRPARIGDGRCPVVARHPDVRRRRPRHAAAAICPARAAPATFVGSGSRAGHVGNGIVPERFRGLPTHAGATRPRTTAPRREGQVLARHRSPRGAQTDHSDRTVELPAVRSAGSHRLPAPPSASRRGRITVAAAAAGAAVAAGQTVASALLPAGGLEPVQAGPLVPVANHSRPTRRGQLRASTRSAATSCCPTRPRWPWTRRRRWT